MWLLIAVACDALAERLDWLRKRVWSLVDGIDYSTPPTRPMWRRRPE